MGARLNQSWELETQPCKTTTESRAPPGDSDERQETEEQVRGAFVFPEVIVFGVGILEDKGGEGFSASAKGCLCRLGVKVVGHGDGS